MWHCVAVWVAPDGLRAHSVILRVKQSKKSRRLDCLILWMKARHYDPMKQRMTHIATLQKMWIFSNTTVTTSSPTEERLAATVWKTDRSAKWYLLHCLQMKPTVMNVWQIYTGNAFIFLFSMYEGCSKSNAPHFFSHFRIKIAMWKLTVSNTDVYCSYVCKYTIVRQIAPL
jgi:hypothetical protein